MFAFLQGKKAELREFVISLSKEFSILSQFTSFVAIEERVRSPQQTWVAAESSRISFSLFFPGVGPG